MVTLVLLCWVVIYCSLNYATHFIPSKRVPDFRKLKASRHKLSKFLFSVSELLLRTTCPREEWGWMKLCIFMCIGHSYSVPFHLLPALVCHVLGCSCPCIWRSPCFHAAKLGPIVFCRYMNAEPYLQLSYVCSSGTRMFDVLRSWSIHLADSCLPCVNHCASPLPANARDKQPHCVSDILFPLHLLSEGSTGSHRLVHDLSVFVVCRD